MSEHPPDWYPDPDGRHQYRFWNGVEWTEQVADHGKMAVDPIKGNAKLPTTGQSEAKLQKQAMKGGAAGMPPAPGGDALMDHQLLVINQKAKLIEINTEYAVYDETGTQVGAIRQVGQSGMKKFLRAVAQVDQFMTHSLQLVDMNNNVLLTITRPAKFAKSKVHITDGAGNEIGSIIQQNMIGKIRFNLEVNDVKVGSLNGENWRAWNFNIQDLDGNEVARITKTFEGVLKTLYTTADNYVLKVSAPQPEPLRSLIVASAVAVDLALKQDARGFS